MERRGIVTASITMLPEITERVRPPRWLAVPYPLGYPLGKANAVEHQRALVRALLELCEAPDVPVWRSISASFCVACEP